MKGPEVPVFTMPPSVGKPRFEGAIFFATSACLKNHQLENFQVEQKQPRNLKPFGFWVDVCDVIAIPLFPSSFFLAFEQVSFEHNSVVFWVMEHRHHILCLFFLHVFCLSNISWQNRPKSWLSNFSHAKKKTGSFEVA